MYHHDDEKDNVEDVDDYHDDEHEQYVLNDDLVLNVVNLIQEEV